MSNSSSSDEGAGECGAMSELAFVKTVKDFPSVFSKSQTPDSSSVLGNLIHKGTFLLFL
jgi:hypothetical protein